MEGYAYKVIPIEKIKKDFPFATRYSLEDQRLKESVARFKIQNPLVVTREGTLIAGHKRLIAAQAGGIKDIPVFELQDKQPAFADGWAQGRQDLFFAALLLNWGQFSSEIDRVWSIRRAKNDFGMGEKAVVENVLPILGLNPEQKIYQFYLKTANLDSSLLDLIAEGALPFRGIQVLAKWGPDDQKTFAHGIARKMSLTTNQLLQAGQWLGDLVRLHAADLKSYVKAAGLEAVLENPRLGRRGKAEHFCRAVRALRFPHLVEREKKFETLSHLLEGEFDEMSVRAPSSFEEEGITLSVRVRNAGSLPVLVEKIRSRYPLLHSLFDVLG